jgi:hypothetical protein
MPTQREFSKTTMSKRELNLPGTDPGAMAVPRPPDAGAALGSMEDSELHGTWHDRVIKDDNDFIVAIAASSRTGLSGTGKTTLGVTLAEHFDRSPGGFDAETQASLDSEAVANELIPDLPQKSAIIFDEAQGTLSSDGVDSRRGMASAVVDMARAAAQFRKRQHTLIIIAQSTDWIDTRMMDLIDRLILIQEKNPREEFARAVTFDHYRDDLPSNTTAKQYTPAIEDIYWEPVPMDSDNYGAMDQMKEAAGGKSNKGGDTEQVSEDRQIALAANFLRNHEDATLRDLPKQEWAEYSREWYRTRLKDLPA